MAACSMQCALAEGERELDLFRDFVFGRSEYLVRLRDDYSYHLDNH